VSIISSDPFYEYPSQSGGLLGAGRSRIELEVIECDALPEPYRSPIHGDIHQSCCRGFTHAYANYDSYGNSDCGSYGNARG
jgi:hypothetical protein